MADDAEILEGQKCPICGKDTLTLTQKEQEVPYFGKLLLFSMTCTSCKYHKADVEAVEKGEPSKYTLEVDSEEDLKARVIKSSEATVKIPRISSISPGASSNGYITNVEGILNRIKHQVETLKETEEDPAKKKKAKNMLKKLQKVMWGSEKTKIIIEDPSGNSSIISDKAEKKKL
ncbi:MAG: ZPR1 zinc finger domain-containing protein [Nanobdellota archaeon]